MADWCYVYALVILCTFAWCLRCENERTRSMGMGQIGAVIGSATVRVPLKVLRALSMLHGLQVPNPAFYVPGDTPRNVRRRHVGCERIVCATLATWHCDDKQRVSVFLVASTHHVWCWHSVVRQWRNSRQTCVMIFVCLVTYAPQPVHLVEFS